MRLDSPPGDVTVRALTSTDADMISRWRYQDPSSVYDLEDATTLSAEHGFHAITAGPTDTLVGFVCVGPEARVEGLTEKPGVIDLGIGLDPVIVGRGYGHAMVAPVLDWLEATHGATEIRAVVQAWNIRSLKLCRRLGFETTGRHWAHQAGCLVEYIVLHRPAS